ncbi:MAG: TolC family protein [Selenomonadaceae bacterium]|nr:TolC family protein [Selenomonadaceae bacterium]
MIFWPAADAGAASLSLQQAIDMALQQNTALRVTQKGEDTAAATLKSAKGTNGVSASLSDSLSVSKDSDSDRASSNSLSVSASLPLYSGGKNQARIESGEIGVDAARLTTQRAQEDLKLNVIKAYYDALEAKKTIDVAQESVDNYQAHLTNVEQLYSAGSKARIDVLRSSVELSNAKQTLIKDKNSYEVNLATLRNYLNMNRAEPLTLTDDFSYTAFPQQMQECIDYALLHRKDILAAEYALKQKELAVKMAKADYLPTLSLTAGSTLLNSQFEPNSNTGHDIRAGLSASWNIFDSGVTAAAVQSAETERDIAKLNLDKDKEDVDLALRQAYLNMREAEERFNSTSDAVHQAEEDFFIAKEKYRAGEGIMLDIIDAQKALSEAKLNYITAQYDYARYKATVENVMGLDLTEGETAAADNLRLTMDSAVKELSVVEQARAREDS